MKIKDYKYIWLPCLLLFYGAAIGIIYGKDFMASGRSLQLFLTLGIDFAVCVILFFVLRKKHRLMR